MAERQPSFDDWLKAWKIHKDFYTSITGENEITLEMSSEGNITKFIKDNRELLVSFIKNIYGDGTPEYKSLDKIVKKLFENNYDEDDFEGEFEREADMAEFFSFLSNYHDRFRQFYESRGSVREKRKATQPLDAARRDAADAAGQAMARIARRDAETITLSTGEEVGYDDAKNILENRRDNQPYTRQDVEDMHSLIRRIDVREGRIPRGGSRRRRRRRTKRSRKSRKRTKKSKRRV